MFNIAICDDEPQVCNQIKRMLEHHKRSAELLITEFHSGEALCGQLANGIVFDLIILDIEFPGLNGVEVGAFLRKRINDDLTQILYVSGKDGYEQSLFDNQPLNFLRKPVDEAKLLSNVDKVLNAAERDMRTYSFSINKVVYRLPLRDIIYFEYLNRRLIIHARNQDYTVNDRLYDMKPLPGFVRIHRSFMVNGLYIRKVMFDSLVLNDGTQLPVSRTYGAELREFMLRQISSISDN